MSPSALPAASMIDPPLSLPEPPGFLRAVSVTLAMALGQAVEGYVCSKEMYFVTGYEPDDDGMFRMQGPFAEWSALPLDLQEEVIEGTLGWFGPFTNPPPVFGTARQDTVCLLQVTPQTPGGEDLKPFPIYPGLTSHDHAPPTAKTEHCDALFLSEAAVQKFAVPYYAAIYGPEFANAMVTAFYESDLALMVHLPWSEYEMESAGGTPETNVVVGGDPALPPPRHPSNLYVFRKRRHFSPEASGSHDYVPTPVSIGWRRGSAER